MTLRIQEPDSRRDSKVNEVEIRCAVAVDAYSALADKVTPADNRVDEPPPGFPSHARPPLAERPLPFQFGIRSLLTVTAGFSVVFALLQWIGLDATSFFLGFLIFGMFCVEASGAIDRSVKRNFHARDPWRPRFALENASRIALCQKSGRQYHERRLALDR